MSKVRKIWDIYRRYGFSGFFNKLSEKLRSPYRDYDRHLAKYLPSVEELAAQKLRQAELSFRPLISIVVPTFETEERFLTDLLDSLGAQTYPRWELVLSDGSGTDRVENALRAYRKAHPAFGTGEAGICYVRLLENGGISANTNGGLKAATGEYIGFMDHDDVLTPNALYEVVSALNEGAKRKEQYRLLYSDEDKADRELAHFSQPHLKKDFDLELLRTNNYICHFLVMDAALVHEIGGFRSAFDGSQDYDFILRGVERLIFPDGHYLGAGREKICHIPKILYHWRMHDASTAGNSSSKSYTSGAGQRAVEAHFAHLGIAAAVRERMEVGCYRITYPEPPDREKALSETEFFLADGLIPRSGSWQEELLRTLSQENVGAVYGKTYRADGHVDQAGVRRLPDGSVEKQFSGLKGSFKGYVRRAVLKQESDAVCYDFAAVRREVLSRPDSRIIFDPDVEADWK